MRRPTVLVGLAVMLAALNLRAPVASVGPVLPELRADLGLSGTGAAVLTALPVVCFGALAVVAPRWARRAGMETVLMVALILLTLGLGTRVWGGPVLLLAGAVVVGGSIAIANVLLPPLIKRDFPDGAGIMMGLYTMCLAGSAALGAGVTVPLGEAIGAGWRGALWIWAVPAALAMAVWLPMLKPRPSPTAPRTSPRSSLARRPLAWQVTIYFGLQSLVFYAMLAWLPSIYREHGYSPAAAGFLLSLCGLVQIPVTLLLPRFAIKASNQVPHIALSTATMGAGLLGILIAPTSAPYLWVTLLGIGCGACFAMGLALFVLRTSRVTETARLSAMAQSIGYLICACGPLLFGLVHDLTHSWNASLAMLLLLLLPQLHTGMLAGRARLLPTAPIRHDRQLEHHHSPQLRHEAVPVATASNRRPVSMRPPTMSKRIRLRELERENRELRMKVDFLSKAVAQLCSRAQHFNTPETAPAAVAQQRLLTQ
jgi:MFS transporter, CP family, cyanate transporter